MKKKMTGLQYLFAPIERVNEEERTVEAYAFVNEVVDGEGGVRLKRSAMEAATPDYMAWANIRRQHQPDPVGVARSVNWDQTGARMVVEVVDDDAWEKVKRGVFKGLSVGVRPTVMRGKSVDACTWIETSLVDRPKDPDARFMAIRAEGIEDEYEVEERGRFNDDLGEREANTLRNFASERLWSILWDIQNWEEGKTPEEREAEARIAIDEFRDYVAPIIGRKEMEAPEDRADEPLIVRGQPITIEVVEGLYEQVSRAEEAQEELKRSVAEVTGQLGTAQGRISELEKTPRRTEPPVRYPAALERTVTAEAQAAGRKTEIERRIAELSVPKAGTPDEVQRAAVAEIGALKAELLTL